MSRHSAKGAVWERNRAITLTRDPTCQIPDPHDCTVTSTEVDHIIPRRHGGSNDLRNLRGACRNGNQARNRTTPRLDTHITL